MIANIIYQGFFRTPVKLCPLKTMEIVSNKVIKDPNLERSPLDGKFLSCKNCETSGICSSEINGSNIPKKQKKPKHQSRCQYKPPREILYVNGMNTKAEANCATAQKLADTLCANVSSYFNATYGLGEDAAESLENIVNNPSPNNPSFGLEEYLRKNKGKKINIVAHSQGGLITRQVLRDISASNETSAGDPYPLENINVVSAGTAEGGWPDGPSYTQYTNTQDVVPNLIADIDSKTGPLSTPTNLTRRRFTTIFSDWILGHSMDDVYISEMARARKYYHDPISYCDSCPHAPYRRPRAPLGLHDGRFL